jgi:maltooligosyltrehalose trehalohydrolase
LRQVTSERLGATPRADGSCRFAVWAPDVERVEVLIGAGGRPVPLARRPRGYHAADVPAVAPGERYRLRLDRGDPVPDPVSRFQPDGVHGPSAVVGDGFRWSDDDWHGIPLSRYVLYELHVGTFTPAGTFDAAIAELASLADLGVTAVELMPVAQFPGERNWGYDGVFPFAVQASYGGPDGLRRFVDAAHRAGLAVVLDAVYNHLGPEGNCLGRFGPYFTDRYRTPWGDAVNFHGEWSDEVRRYFLENAAMWISEFHVDALRLDAVHAIHDQSARPFLAELAETVEAAGERAGRRAYAIAEMDVRDPQLTRPGVAGGLGLHAQWCDDLHHAVHAALTGERDGYYGGFGGVEEVTTALRRGWVRVRAGDDGAREEAAAAPEAPGERLVVCSQNHDQIGNRMHGERLAAIAGEDAARLAAGIVLLSPFVPLLFMGEEYGEPAPFLYFVSHSDPDLVAAVRRGRRAEFESFAWAGEPLDPQSPEAFAASRIDRCPRERGRHGETLGLYRELLRLRREVPALAHLDPAACDARADAARSLVTLHRRHRGSEAFAVFNLGAGAAPIEPPGGSCWAPALRSDAGDGDLAPRSFAVLVREGS